MNVTATFLARGHHKSARGHEAKLLEMLKDKVKRGWQLLMPKEAALKLPCCEVAPLGSDGVADNHRIQPSEIDETQTFS